MSLSDLSFSRPLSSPSAVLNARENLAATITGTTHEPFVYPYRALGPHLFIAYLLLPPANSSGKGFASTLLYAKTAHHLRWPVFLIASGLCIQALVECRSSMVTVGYGIGLINAWSVLWMACWMVFGDGREARRIERRHRGSDEKVKGGRNREKDKVETDGEATQGLRRRQWQKKGNKFGGYGREPAAEAEEVDGFFWQGLPSTLVHRIDWVADLITNFRGIRWSHQISGLPYPDSSSITAFTKPISHQTASFTAATPSTSRHDAYPTRSAVIHSSLVGFVINLLVLDLLKYLMLQDPYFWGISNPGPSPYPFPRTVRLILSLAGVYTSLLNIFLLSPLVYCGLAGEKYFCEHAWPWLYPSYYGSPVQVWNKGLAGIWGGWWHQLFRLGFEQAGDFVGREVGWEKRSAKGGILRVLVAFVCSGCLHASGSYTALGNTRPRNAFIFFAIQPAGLITQRAVARWMEKSGFRDRIPASIRGACNVIVAVGWCWLTGPLIADDFARSGIWLYEPMPISLARGLAGEGWWYWGGTWFQWHFADRWWKSGIAL